MSKHNNKGKNNPFYGKKHKKSTKRKISSIRIKKELAKGKNNPMYGKHHTKTARKKMSKWKKGKNYGFVGKKHWSYGTKHTKAHNKKISKAVKGKNSPCYGKHPSKETRERMRIAQTGKKLSREWKKNIGKASKKLWKNKIYRDKVVMGALKGLQLKPNRPEKIVTAILKALKLKKFRYVGDGQVVLGGFNPDFIDKQSKKIVEVYGDYWHNLPSYKERDTRRKKVYKNLGHKLLIVWEHELKSISTVTEKILKFGRSS